MKEDIHCSIAIVGGGPAGSTLGTLLKKYAPELAVVILERERFPREHIGESQLPPVSAILHEMGVWDKVEAANFPVKVGGTFLWGRSSQLWDINFVPRANYENMQRPGTFEGFRRFVAFQVERAIYDDILLRHAEQAGCTVLEETKVSVVKSQGDRIGAFQLADGRTVVADYYVDASGGAAVIRRAMGIETDCPTQLRNVAVWDYWECDEWAEGIGFGGTRVHIISLGYGWVWVIPLGPKKASVGLVCPAKYLKESGKELGVLYGEALRADPTLVRLLAAGSPSGRLQKTKDWSFVANRMSGKNWFLVGESAGFADPILSAGLTLAQGGARELAYTLVELYRGQHDPEWLSGYYSANQERRVRQHIRFADFFYAANGQFSELRENCAEIAKASGLTLTPDAAWRWLTVGGFTNEVIGQPALAGFDLDSARQVTDMLCGGNSTWVASDFNVFRLDLEGAESEFVPVYDSGRIDKVVCYQRNGYRLPLAGIYGLLVQVLKATSAIDQILRDLVVLLKDRFSIDHAKLLVRQAMQALEVMIQEGWVKASVNEQRPRLSISTLTETISVQSNSIPMEIGAGHHGD